MPKRKRRKSELEEHLEELRNLLQKSLDPDTDEATKERIIQGLKEYADRVAYSTDSLSWEI